MSPSPTLSHPIGNPPVGATGWGRRFRARAPALPSGTWEGHWRPERRPPLLAAHPSAEPTLSVPCAVSSLGSAVSRVCVRCAPSSHCMNSLKSHKGGLLLETALGSSQEPPRVPPTGSPQNTCEGLTCCHPSRSLSPMSRGWMASRASGRVPGGVRAGPAQAGSSTWI